MKKIWLLALLFSGCGGGGYTKTSTSTIPPTTPVPEGAKVTGRYDVVLTSTKGHGTTYIYTNFTQSGKTFTGAANTVVCPNALSQCVGDDSPVVSITPSGIVNGSDVTIMISFPGAAGADTVTMVGAATGPGTDISGTSTNTQGDAGTFSAFVAGAVTLTLSGTFNSTPNPLPIAPTILIALTEAQDGTFHLTGTATIMNSPCISSLTLSGQAVGDALKLSDNASKVHILVVPGSNNLIFSYSFEPDAPSCAGDFGLGMTSTSPWDYLKPRH
jgi:hypothetical protein